MLHYYHVIVIIFLYGLIGIFVKMLNCPLNTFKHHHPLEITHWFLDFMIAIIHLFQINSVNLTPPLYFHFHF